MKKILTGFLITLVLLQTGACRKNKEADLSLTTEEKQQLAALGFRSNGACRHGDGYLMEGDIFLSRQQVQQGLTTAPEQYRNATLVTGLPRTITIRYSGTITTISNALNTAVACFNAQGLQLRFQRVAAGAAANITLNSVSGVNYISTAGFPAGGNPFSSISINSIFSTRPNGFITRILLHAMGHCIGYRHTDPNTPLTDCYGFQVSGGGSGGGIGGILIPGTTPGPDPDSWMNACPNYDLGCFFSAFDRIALRALYL